MSSLLRPSLRVLPTLNQDGSRRLVRPRLYPGKYHDRRRVVAWALMITFCSLPFIKMGGKPAVLLDIGAREFVLFGRTFLATDGVLLMLLMLSIFVAIFLLTALVGRAWCGWGCPQTVYMEFLFRPIEVWFEGGPSRQLKLDREGANFRRVAKNVVFLLIAFLLANVFLSYFVGIERLRHWIFESPSAHLLGFSVVVVTTALVFFDFAYFREQMCTVLCPYARLQSALLDKGSVIIGYDAARGEPRGKQGPGQRGDCVDCGACKLACPTGIDIREGLQLECIACAQCVDACDSIMARVGKPLGLIRYASQASLEKSKPPGLARARTLIYPALLVVLVGALIWFGGGQKEVDVTVLRGLAAPFVLQGESVQNQLRVKVRNRSGAEQLCQVSLDDSRLTLIMPENPMKLLPGAQLESSAFVLGDVSLFQKGVLPLAVTVQCASSTVVVPYKLLGPISTVAGVKP